MSVNQKKKSSFFIFAFFLILSVFALFFINSSFFLPKIVKESLGSLFGFVSFQSQPSIAQKVQGENKKLIEQIAKLKLIEQENKALRDQFESSSVKTSNLLPARVIGAPRFIPGISYPEYLILDKGEKDGVFKNDGVVVKNTLIGRITRISNSLSVVMLTTNEHFSIIAKTVACPSCLDFDSKPSGLLRGRGVSQMVIENILVSEKIQKGDFVVTKGDIDEKGRGVPPGLLLGEIRSIDKKSSELFQSARVEGIVDISKVSLVFIIKHM